MKVKVMNWKPNCPAPQPAFIPQAQDPNTMDIDRLSINEQNDYLRKGLCF